MENAFTKTEMRSLRRKFAREIADARKEQRLTQEELSARCDLSVDTVKRIEAAGNPYLESAIQIARVLGISLDYLFLGGEKEREDKIMAELKRLQNSVDELRRKTL